MADRSGELRPVIGLTIGVWDLLHEGHLAMLADCASRCEYLIVGVMTDHWVRVQKGRPPYRKSSDRHYDVRASGLCHRVIYIDTLDLHHYSDMCDVWFLGHDQFNMRPQNPDPEDQYHMVRLPKHGDVTTTSLLEKGRSYETEVVFRGGAGAPQGRERK